MTTAWLFPGQGSQYAGMGAGDRELRDATADLFDAAERRTGLPLRELALHGPADELRQPRVAELLLTVHSLAHARLLARLGDRPAAVAGYSAGETAALCVAGVLDEQQALEAAVVRGGVLQRFIDPATRLVAISGIPAEVAQRFVKEAEEEGFAAVAACNASDHVTVAGAGAALARVVERARRGGALVSSVEVSGPWHTDRVVLAARAIHARLTSLHMRPPALSLLMSASGRAARDPELIRRLFARQVCSPVRFTEIVRRLVERGVRRFVEVGPGRTLYSFLLREFGAASGLTLEHVDRPAGRRQRTLDPARSRAPDRALH